MLFLSFVIFPALAVTSESYVDSAVAPLQKKISAVNDNTVLTYSGFAGSVGAKPIYDENSDFASQTDSLVTAETFNAAVQNAIDTEFVCIESIPEGCLLYKIQNVTQKTTTQADGYTRLEYIVTQDGAYINTQKQLGANFEIYATVMALNQGYQFLGSSASDYRDFFVGVYSYSLSSSPLLNTSISNNFYGGGIGFPGLNQKFTFGISPQWTENFLGKKVQLNRPYRGKGSLVIGRAAERPQAPIRFYSVKLYNNGVLDADFIPVRRNSDGELGMYDTVSGTFLTNTGNGTFGAGPDLGPNIYLPSGV